MHITNASLQQYEYFGTKPLTEIIFLAEEFNFKHKYVNCALKNMLISFCIFNAIQILTSKTDHWRIQGGIRDAPLLSSIQFPPFHAVFVENLAKYTWAPYVWSLTPLL